MGTRIFNRILECGCAISSDSGGGLMPCHYYVDTEEDKIRAEKCDDAWEKWKKTKDYQKYLKELEERN